MAVDFHSVGLTSWLSVSAGSIRATPSAGIVVARRVTAPQHQHNEPDGRYIVDAYTTLRIARSTGAEYQANDQSQARGAHSVHT